MSPLIYAQLSPGLIILIVLGGLALIYLLWLLIEPLLLEHTVYHFGDRHQDDPTTLTITYFSDYHAVFRRVPFNKLKAIISKTPTDLVFFGGDLSSGEQDKAKGLREFRQLADALKSEQDQALYGVWGNHDASLTREEALEHGLHLLANESILVQDPSGLDWLIAGEEDIRTGDPDAERAWETLYPIQKDALMHDTDPTGEALTRRIQSIPRERRIVIGHNPDQILKLKPEACQFFLSGHFHGGQIRLPFRIEYSLLRSEQLIDEGVYQGVFERNGILGFISRGVGCVLFPFRFLSRPEVSTIHFYASKRS